MGSDTRKLFLICSKVHLFNFVTHAVTPGFESCIFSDLLKPLCPVMDLPIPILTLSLQNVEATGVSRKKTRDRE